MAEGNESPSWTRGAAHCLAVWTILAGFAYAQVRADESVEYQVKAGCLFNFTKFVEWPADSFPSAHAPLVIGILGEDPFGPVFADSVEGETAQGHPLKVRHIDNAEDIEPCHILFISSSERHRLPEILKKLKNKGILTVGEVPEFTRLGGMVRFYVEGGKVRLEFNLDAARAARLAISANLLALGKVIKGAWSEK